MNFPNLLLYYNTHMQKGTVKFFNQPKGFGFIIEEGTGRDIFFHVTKTAGYQPGSHISFNEGETVTFEEVEGKKGPEAIDVARAEGGHTASMDMDSDEDDAS
jgi:CspA family cold shock protein